MDPKKISPAGHRIMVEVEVPDEKTSSGLYIPTMSKDRKMNEGEISRLIAVGPQAWKAFADGSPWAKVGDRVLCIKHAGTVVAGNPRLRLMNDEDLLGVFPEARSNVEDERIAMVCHEVNRAYCQSLGDNSQTSWKDAPEWQKESARLGVKLHIDNPDVGAEASHESWMEQKTKDGWVWGKEKDPDAKKHPCLVPFNELPLEQQSKDYIFRAIVHAMTED
jgi:co-chaperonin GroES (HSP10)